MGIDQRTVREYESHAAWREAVKTAGDRWHTSLVVRARGRGPGAAPEARIGAHSLDPPGPRL